MCFELIPHERAYSVNFPWQMMTTNFVLNTDGSFQCTLSIPGQFPAFLPHTTVHRALSITVPWSSPCVKLSIGAFYGALSDWARVALRDSYIPSSPLPRPPCTHWHSYIPPTPGVQSPSWVTGRQLSWCALLSSRIIIAPLLYLQQISISICFVPRGG